MARRAVPGGSGTHWPRSREGGRPRRTLSSSGAPRGKGAKGRERCAALRRCAARAGGSRAGKPAARARARAHRHGTRAGHLQRCGEVRAASFAPLAKIPPRAAALRRRRTKSPDPTPPTPTLHATGTPMACAQAGAGAGGGQLEPHCARAQRSDAEDRARRAHRQAVSAQHHAARPTLVPERATQAPQQLWALQQLGGAQADRRRACPLTHLMAGAASAGTTTCAPTSARTPGAATRRSCSSRWGRRTTSSRREGVSRAAVELTATAPWARPTTACARLIHARTRRLQAHKALGNRWSDIAKTIPGRSENVSAPP